MNPLQFTATAHTPSIPFESSRESLPRNRAPKRSRAAEYIAALYIALVLCTPWLLRDASWLTPPSNGIEIQLSKGAPTPPPHEVHAPTEQMLKR